MQEQTDIEYYEKILAGYTDCQNSETYSGFICAYENLTRLIGEAHESRSKTKTPLSQEKIMDTENKAKCESKISPEDYPKESTFCMKEGKNSIELFRALGFDVEINVKPTENQDGKGVVSLNYIK
jgi:hypothetical protein